MLTFCKCVMGCPDGYGLFICHGEITRKNLNGGTSKDGKTKETWNRNENEFCKAR